jgi:hypothetical protein
MMQEKSNLHNEWSNCHQRIGLGEIWVFENRQPVTEAKLVNKC